MMNILTINLWINLFLLSASSIAYFYVVRKFVITGGINFLEKKFSVIKIKQNDYGLQNYLNHFSIGLYIIFLKKIFVFFVAALNLTQILAFLTVILSSAFTIYFTFFSTKLLICITNICSAIYKKHYKKTSKALSLYMQIIKIVIIGLAILICTSEILGISLKIFFTSIGAATALISFIFKDTILGLVASFQLTLQDSIREGDWIHIPSLNVEGDVEEITITTTKIRNFDKTISIVPTHSLLKCDIKNWRGMQEAGGRRIKRSLYINMDTIKFCDDKMINSLKDIPLLAEYLADISKLSDKTSRKITNIGLFRHYTLEYLKHNKNIHQSNFTFLVRQLQPTRYGLPLELYIFTNDTNWNKYEQVQADIFDHLFAIISKFDLKNFQNMSSISRNFNFNSDSKKIT